MEEWKGDMEYSEEPKGLRTEIEEIKNLLQSDKRFKKKNKDKGFPLPIRAKFGRKKLRSGWCVVMQVAENKVVTLRKAKIEDGVIKLNDARLGDTYHAIKNDDVLYYKGKKPLVIIAKNKINPYNPLVEKHETYGQKYIVARIMKDVIKPKRSFGGIAILLIVILIIGVVWYMRNKGAG